MKAFYHSPVGLIELTENDGYLCSLRIIDIINQASVPSNTESGVLQDAIKQLEEYFEGKRLEFNLPLRQTGTEYQQKAWAYLLTIPYGQTVTYKDQAEAIDSPKGFRAVGTANGRNNIPIIVPCHRVVNSEGGLGGYAYGLDVKARLLALEQRHKKD